MSELDRVLAETMTAAERLWRRRDRRGRSALAWIEAALAQIYDPTTGQVPPSAIPPQAGMTNPMTTAEDIIKAGSGGTPVRVPVGADGTILRVVAGIVTWAAETVSALATTVVAETGWGQAATAGTATTAARGDHTHGTPPAPIVREVDGAPTIGITALEFPNGTVTEPSAGVARYTPAPPPPSLTVEEIDGAPSGTPTTLQFPNGTVADQGGGVFRYTPSATAGGSRSILVDQVTPDLIWAGSAGNWDLIYVESAP